MSSLVRIIPKHAADVRNRKGEKISWVDNAGVELYVRMQKCRSFAAVLVLPSRPCWCSTTCEAFIGHFSKKLSQTYL